MPGAHMLAFKDATRGAYCPDLPRRRPPKGCCAGHYLLPLFGLALCTSNSTKEDCDGCEL